MDTDPNTASTTPQPKAAHTPGLHVRLTPASQVMRLAGRLSAARITIELRVADSVRARECREVLAREFPGARACKTHCDGHDGFCDECLRWSDLTILNAKINRRAIAKAEGR